MRNKFILFFKSKSVLFMAALTIGLVLLGLTYDGIFGKTYPIQVRTLDDLTTGAVITTVGALGFILSIPAMWVYYAIKEKRNER